MRRLAFVLAHRRSLDAVIDAVPEKMDERVFHLFEDPPVDFDLASPSHQLQLLALLARKLAGESWKELEQRGERQHLHLLHVVKKVVHHSAQGAMIVLGGPLQFCYPTLDCFQEYVFRFHILEQLRQFRLPFRSRICLVRLCQRPLNRTESGLDPGSFPLPGCERHTGFAQLEGMLARCLPRNKQLFRLPHHRVEFRQVDSDRPGTRAVGRRQWRTRIGAGRRPGQCRRRWSILRRRSRRRLHPCGRHPFRRVVEPLDQRGDRRLAGLPRLCIGSKKPCQSVKRLMDKIEERRRGGDTVALQSGKQALQRVAHGFDLRAIHRSRGTLQAVRLPEDLLDDLHPLLAGCFPLQRQESRGHHLEVLACLDLERHEESFQEVVVLVGHGVISISEKVAIVSLFGFRSWRSASVPAYAGSAQRPPPAWCRRRSACWPA